MWVWRHDIGQGAVCVWIEESSRSLGVSASAPGVYASLCVGLSSTRTPANRQAHTCCTGRRAVTYSKPVPVINSAPGRFSTRC